MEKFIEIIDTFLLNYSNYNNGTQSFECDYGEIIFLKNGKNMKQIKNKKVKKEDTIIIHGIYIKPEYRNKGFCKNILFHLIDKCCKNFQYLCIQSVISKVLYEYLLRFEYNSKKFLLKKDGFFYKL
jgi:RimJ/RimL family protein N-acetyltransferase